MMVLGERVAGGKMYGRWPGLDNEHLYERADLAVTTDYRQILCEILVKRLSNPKVSEVFPGYSDFKPLGLLSA
jgi:uncharacterized protein (DUF1501 family)